MFVVDQRVGHRSDTCACAGGLLNYDAVKQALDTGHLGGLGLDVQWVEPWDPQDPINSDPRQVPPQQ